MKHLLKAWIVESLLLDLYTDMYILIDMYILEYMCISTTPHVWS